MTNITQLSSKESTNGSRILIAFLVLGFIALQPGRAEAQWTTPTPPNTNINNTNTGNVGVGTTTPAYKLEVANIEDKAQIRFGLGALDSGGFLFSNSPSHAVFSGGASWNGGWIAKSMSASFMESSSGAFKFYGNTGLTSGASFTPVERMTINPSGLVGIGISIPAYSLDVNGGTNGFRAKAASASSSDTIATFENSAGIQGIFRANGNFGLGTTSPGAKLVTIGNVLSGNITNHTQLYSTYDSQNNVIMELGYGTATANITPYPSFVISKNLTSTSSLLGMISFANSSIANGNEKRLANISSWTDGATNSGALMFYTNGAGTLAERLRITSGGNVGIGSPTPQYKLDVAGEIRSSIGGFRFPDGSVQITAATGGGGSVASVFGRTGTVVAAANDYTWAQINKSTSSLADLTTRSAGDLSSGTLPDGRFPATLPALSGVNLTSLNSSNLTSGTVPTARLGSGTANNTTFLRGDNSWAAITSSQWTTNGTHINYAAAGNVGIGIEAPTTKLQVAGSARVDGTSGRVYLGTVAAAGSSGLEFVQENATTFSIRHHDPNVAWRDIVINPYAGNVGIGTISPNAAYKLDVNGNTNVTGNINVTGSINAKYQDVAEWVESSQVLGAGTVVVLDHTRSNQVVASSRAYDTRVAGVISLQPGIALGESGATKVLVATTGRVKIKVDASASPIQIGDLLVTSDKEGVAKKSEPIEVSGRLMHMPGTLIGKALEPLAKGTGEILVLLSLQ